MIDLHPNFLEKDGKKAFAVLSYEEFTKIQEALEDLKTLRQSKMEQADEPMVSLEEAKELLAL